MPATTVTRAMILAGGLSTRLYPLTKTVPKPLVPVAGEPISGNVMRWLASFGLRDVAINVFYHADAVRAAFGDGSAFDVDLTYLDERELTGSAGALKQLESRFDRTFVVVGCDVLTDADLASLIRFHHERGALATIGLIEADEVDQYGVVVLDDDGRITGFQEKPAPGTELSHLVNTGIYVFEPEIFERIPADTFYDFGKQVFPELLADGLPFYGMTLTGAYWRDIGTPSEYRRANIDVLEGRVRLVSGRSNGVPSDATVGDGVIIEGDVRIGARAVIGDHARIVGPTVIGNDARIGADAVIERSILWDHVDVGARATVRDTIVGNDYALPDGATVADAIVANEPPE
jgi:mannose-1-phosphate guanylyltransferase/mannose-1-phosphate guanylyltransferase/phosphomannomutase